MIMKSNCCNAEVILNEGLLPICAKCGFPCETIVEEFTVKNLIEVYKLGYADRNAKMTPFGDQDPKEYILYHLKNM